jgi:hypothetical protein
MNVLFIFAFTFASLFALSEPTKKPSRKRGGGQPMPEGFRGGLVAG